MATLLSDDVVRVNEYELHDLLATWYHLHLPKAGNGPIQAIELEAGLAPQHWNPDPKKVEELMRRVNAVIKEMHELDHFLHSDDLFGYTC